MLIAAPAGEVVKASLVAVPVAMVRLALVALVRPTAAAVNV